MAGRMPRTGLAFGGMVDLSAEAEAGGSSAPVAMAHEASPRYEAMELVILVFLELAALGALRHLTRRTHGG